MVSQDILEKIRECGSSVTYYGGRVVDNKSTEVSPMTKAIMQEIRGQNKMCGVCQPNNCPHQTTLFPKVRETDNSNLGELSSQRSLSLGKGFVSFSLPVFSLTLKRHG